jgi:hypothetical protein
MTRPAIRGPARVGRVLRAAAAQWKAPGAISVRREWLRCGRRGGICRTIQGAAEVRYRLRRSDLGHRVRVREVASHGLAASRVVSQPTAAVRRPR